MATEVIENKTNADVIAHLQHICKAYLQHAFKDDPDEMFFKIGSVYRLSIDFLVQDDQVALGDCEIKLLNFHRRCVDE